MEADRWVFGNRDTGAYLVKFGRADYRRGRREFIDAQRRRWERLPKSAATPLFGLDAVLFHRGQEHVVWSARRGHGRACSGNATREIGC